MKKYPVIHKNGCGGIIAYTKNPKPESGDRILGSDFFHLNGELCKDGEPIICESCKEHLTELFPEWIET